MTAPASVRDVLVKARELIATPDRWTKGAFARTEAGAIVPPDRPVAACWCAIGALRRVTGDTGYRGAFVELQSAADYDLPHWNDAPERTHDEVLAAFDRAIAAAGEPS